MHVPAISTFFYRPLFAASRYCADKIEGLWKKCYARYRSEPFTHSILGRFVECSVAETVGAGIGGLMGGKVLSLAGEQAGKYLVPLSLRYCTLGVVGALFLIQIKTHRKALGLLGIALSVEAIKNMFGEQNLCEFGAGLGSHLGGWLGRSIGVILGGYAALKAANADVVFWDRRDSYPIGMTKYLLAGDIFENVIVRSSTPYLSIPLNLGRACVKLTGCSIAYNSDAVITLAKTVFREKKINSDAIIPLVVKIFCSRFCERNSLPLTTRIIRTVSNAINIVPMITGKFQFILRQNAVAQLINEQIVRMGRNSDLLAGVLMRSFVEYVNLVRTLNISGNISGTTFCPKAFKKALKASLPGAANLSPVVEACMRETLNQTAQKIVDALEQAELDSTGYILTEEKETLKDFLRLHIKYYFIHTLLKYDTTSLKPEEEESFFLNLNELFFQNYRNSRNSHKIARGLGNFIEVGLRASFGFRKWVHPFIEHPEEQVVTHTPRIDIDEKSIHFTKETEPQSTLEFEFV